MVKKKQKNIVKRTTVRNPNKNLSQKEKNDNIE